MTGSPVPGTSPAYPALEPGLRSRLMELDAHRVAQLLDPLPLFHPATASGQRAAAVLAALRPAAVGPEVLLARRAQHLDEHAGQIALPGGRVDEGDATPAHTALREAWEETGLEAGRVQLLGALHPLSVPVSRHCVQPVVGWLEGDSPLTPSLGETADLWFTPLGDLLACARAVDLRGHPAWDFPLPGARVWGMTALVLEDLLVRLGLLSARSRLPRL